MTEEDAHAAAAVAPRGRSTSGVLMQGTRRPRPGGGIATVHGSDKRMSTFDSKIFATNDQETEHDRDARAVFERSKGMDNPGDGSVYRGANNYRNFTEKAETFDKAVLSGKGPQRASMHYRAICRFDYQPDICKDYKETGYCGYGDACVFLHDRGDYKSGWQLEKEWEAAEKEREKERQRRLARGDGDADGTDAEGTAEVEDDGLPFACLLCRKPWTVESNPVVTKCGHHFCETCALTKVGKRCATCNEPTHGTFNAAKRLRQRIAKQGDSVAQAPVAKPVEAQGQRPSTVSSWVL